MSKNDVYKKFDRNNAAESKLINIIKYLLLFNDTNYLSLLLATK